MVFVDFPLAAGQIVAGHNTAAFDSLISHTNFPGSGLPGSGSTRLTAQDPPLLAQRSRILGNRKNNKLQGRAGADSLYGRAGNDVLRGFAGNDKIYGEQGDDRLWGGTGDDYLNGGSGRNILYGEAGHDQLLGGKDADQLVGGMGNDSLNGGGGRNRLTGGAGRDRFVIVTGLVEITDFKDGEDLLELGAGLKFEDLVIVQAAGQQVKTLIQNQLTGASLAILNATKSTTITSADFAGVALPPESPPIGSDLKPAVTAIQASPIKFSASDPEATIAATGAARIQIGSQTLYVGTQQVSSDNQNPVIVSFDASNPANNWKRTDYEMTGTDGRGYGLFWSGSQLYGVFSVDGTQGTPDQDFRRASSGATQSWLKSYGTGGGAKVAVLAKLNPSTGEMTDAVYLSAINSGKSNSFVVKGLSLNAAGNLVVNAQSYFAPRRPDGQAMTQTSTGGSPFDYTLEITPDLKTVVSTAAVGWS